MSPAGITFSALQDLVPAMRVVPLSTQVFWRLAKRADSAFLLEESIRFVNFGARPKGTVGAGEGFVHKEYPRITTDALELALNEFCSSHTEFIYEHVKKLYAGLGPKTLPDFSAKWRTHLWMKMAAADEPLKAVLVPHAMFGTLDGPAIKTDVLQFTRVVEAYQRSARLLGRFHGEIEAIIGMLAEDQRAALVTDAWLALDSGKGIGSPYSIDTTSHPTFLSEFGGGAAGLTEKIYSALVLCVSTAGFRQSAFDFDKQPPLLATGESRAIEDTLRHELQKLAGRFGVKKRPLTTLENWLDGIRQLEEWLNLFFVQAAGMPVAPGAAGVASTITSDIIWGLVFCSYVRLHLVRALALATTASVPFRQIHEGGPLRPGESDREVSGVVGIIGVSLWEYFTGAPTPQPAAEGAVTRGAPGGARTYAPSKSGWDEKLQWLDPKTSQGPPADLRGLPNPLFSNGGNESPFRPEVSVTLDGPFLSPDTRRAYSMLQLPLVALSYERPGPLQRYAGLNKLRPPGRRSNETGDEWRKRLSKTLAGFQDFPPSGVFGSYASSNGDEGLRPIFVEQNPPVRDTFFVLGEAKDRVFNKWGAGSDSNLSYANKLSCQLQMYVAGWLCLRFMEEAQSLAPEFSGLSREIKFTQGSIPFGGKFPPHETHRDGYGADWSYYGTSERYWAWSVHWPRDDKLTERVIDGKTQQVSMAEALMGETEPLRRKCQLVRLSFGKLLNEPGATPAKIEAARRRISDELATFIPTKYLRGHTDKHGNNTIAAIPSDVLIASRRDNYGSGRQGTGQPTYVFRDHLKDLVYNDQESCEKYLREPLYSHSFDQINSEFEKLVNSYRDWPVFPDRRSHWAHHVAHLAILLSMPVEFCWGAPIYHFRALRAACLGFLDAPYHPFVRPPDEVRKKMDRDLAMRRWPLPIPRLQFLPHDHHHHWHLNYWRTEGSPLPQSIQSRLPSGVTTHLDFVTSCLPMWVMLGVDFEGFEKYLVDYATVASGGLFDQITALRMLLDIDHRRIVEALPTEFTSTIGDFRRRLVELALENFEDPSGLAINWPAPGSPLDEEIRDARMIKTGVDRIAKRITKDMLPTEILEALDRPPDERDFELQRSDSAVPEIAGEERDERELHQGDSEGRSKNLDERYEPQEAATSGPSSTPVSSPRQN